MKTNRNTLVISVVVAIILMCVASTGCIKLVQKNIDNQDPNEVLDEKGLPAGSASEPVQPTPAIPLGQEEISSWDSTVRAAEPILPRDNFRIVRNLTGRNGEPANPSLHDTWVSRMPLYSLHYSPRYNASAVEVNVTRGPLVINFRAVPVLNEPRISFADITIRELPSGRIVAEEHIDHFLAPAPEEEKTVIIPDLATCNLRQVVLFREGRYHINSYGNQVDIDLAIYTGDSPLLTSNTPVVSDSALPAEDEVWA
ncbi:MAG TPA: hypothetical protein VHN82_03770 [Methanoregula sp.]|nr:hypothetical protein [Methanoregula sp.]